MSNCPYSLKGCLRRPENKNNCYACPRNDSNSIQFLNRMNSIYDEMQSTNDENVDEDDFNDD